MPENSDQVHLGFLGFMGKLQGAIYIYIHIYIHLYVYIHASLLGGVYISHLNIAVAISNKPV